MKNVRIISILLTFIVVFVSAELKIVYPSKDYYLVAGAPDQVIWTYEAGDPATFSIFLTNPKIVDLKQYALANNVATKVGKINVEINPNFVGTGFQIMFTNIGNITQSYATSDPFEIKEQGTEPTVYVTPTPSATSTNNSTENGNTKANSSNSIHGYGFGILVLITLITMISFN